MKNYNYKVCLCDGHYCRGKIFVQANTEEEAYEKVVDSIGERLRVSFPELDINYWVELIEVEK